MIHLSEGTHRPQIFDHAQHIVGEGYHENGNSTGGTVIEQKGGAGGSAVHMQQGEGTSYQRNASVCDLAIICRDETRPAILVDNIQQVLIENIFINLRDTGLSGIQLIEGMRSTVRNVKISKVKGVGLEYIDSTGGGMTIESLYTSGSGTGVRVRHNGTSILRGEINQNTGQGVGIHLDMAPGNGAGDYFYLEGTRLEVKGTSRCGLLIESEHGEWNNAVINYPQISLRDSESLAIEVANGANNVFNLTKGFDKHEGSRYIHFGPEAHDNTVYVYGSLQLVKGFNYTDEGCNNRVINL